MNKTMLDGNEMQDEELYALLDKALCTERLTVSEELIRKTLQRVAVEEDSKVISFEKAKKKFPYLRYASVAAAAVLVLFVGVRTFNGDNFTAEDAQMKARSNVAPEAEADTSQIKWGEVADATNSGVTDDESMYYYSVSDSPSDLSVEAPEEVEIEEFPGTDSRGGTATMVSTAVTVSDDLTVILKDAGMAAKTQTAEYWEFVTGETDWEEELVNALRACVIVRSGLPESGNYSYVLDCKDGSRRNVVCNTPLDAVVRLKTEQGVIWGLLGESVSFYME